MDDACGFCSVQSPFYIENAAVVRTVRKYLTVAYRPEVHAAAVRRVHEAAGIVAITTAASAVTSMLAERGRKSVAQVDGGGREEAKAAS